MRVSHRSKILQFLEGRKTGVTCAHICWALSLKRSTASARLHELVSEGKIKVWGLVVKKGRNRYSYLLKGAE